jgi:hypothetical protein
MDVKLWKSENSLELWLRKILFENMTMIRNLFLFMIPTLNKEILYLSMVLSIAYFYLGKYDGIIKESKISRKF